MAEPESVAKELLELHQFEELEKLTRHLEKHYLVGTYLLFLIIDGRLPFTSQPCLHNSMVMIQQLVLEKLNWQQQLHTD